MVTYQVELLTQLAERLDRRARLVPWIVGAVGAGAGAGAGIFVAVFLFPGGGPWYAVVLAVLLGAVSYYISEAKALELQLEAQTALCQKQIEENTRRR